MKELIEALEKQLETDKEEKEIGEAKSLSIEDIEDMLQDPQMGIVAIGYEDGPKRFFAKSTKHGLKGSGKNLTEALYHLNELVNEE